eukprot:GHVR01171730.1.p1 GENE.GHVR01171730.1~~GHVR01171730.1.p1  ORF type:complete len:309 (+),score=54.97 GHVR01171730.1:219-1145(+)
MCKVHGSLGVICEGLFPELEEFSKSACDEEKRLLLNENDWKSMRDGLKQMAKIMERIPIFDQRQLNSVQSAIGCGSGSADINAILRDFNVFPKGTWKSNNWQQYNNADQPEDTEQPQNNQFKGNYQGKKNWNNQQQQQPAVSSHINTHEHNNLTTTCTPNISSNISHLSFQSNPPPIPSEITRKRMGFTRLNVDSLEKNRNTHRTTHTIAPHTHIVQLNPCNTHTHAHTLQFQAPIVQVATNNKYNIHTRIKTPVDLVVKRTDQFDHLYIHHNNNNCDNNKYHNIHNIIIKLILLQVVVILMILFHLE